MSVEIARRSFTVEEYEHMYKAGVFPNDARLELIEGEIHEISPSGSLHAACVDAIALRLNARARILNESARSRFNVSVQSPVRLNDFSKPQPDIMLLRWRGGFYRDAPPAHEDVLLVVEVADTTVETDRRIKTPLYARAGIAEVWIVNIPDARIEVYSGPVGDAYMHIERFGRGSRAQSQTLEGFDVGVQELLG